MYAYLSLYSKFAFLFLHTSSRQFPFSLILLPHLTLCFLGDRRKPKTISSTVTEIRIMESKMFDNVKSEKEKAIARFNRFARLRQFLEVLVVFGLISWSSAQVAGGGFSVDFSTYLFNHHVVFLIGNAIIVLLFTLCGQNDEVSLSAGGDDFYGDYVRFDEAVHLQEPTLSPVPLVKEIAPSAGSDGGDDEKKEIVVRAEEAKAISRSGDVEVIIGKARRQLKKFQRTQSEIAVRQRKPELRRSETENCRKTASTSPVDVAEIENLSGEEFRRRVDAFIDKHWGRRSTKPSSF